MPAPRGHIDRTDAWLVRYRLERAVGGSGVSAVDVVVVELGSSDGATGLGFSYLLGGYGGPAVLGLVRALLADHVAGHPLAPPASTWRRIAATFNRSGLGPNLLALAAIDVALWDLEARRRELPLGVSLGGQLRDVPVYGSGGFAATQSPAAAADTAAAHAARGLRGVKARVAGVRGDEAVMQAVRQALPRDVHLMVDANEKCDLTAARWLLAAAADTGVLFVEEPVRADDVEAYRALARCGAPLATGEHLQGRAAFLPFLSERLAGVIQPDVAMAGGLTPILELATLAEAFGVGMSPHFLPGLAVHLAAASPAITWLEEFPLLEPLFDGWPSITGGTLRALDTPGHGLQLAAAARQLATDA